MKIKNIAFFLWIPFLMSAPEKGEYIHPEKLVILMRHALAPGGGDPPHFKIGNRSTQRNLSQRGRRQAARAGDVIRKTGVEDADVFSSEWYRCLDTAELLDFGEVEVLESLNSFFDYPHRKREQTEAVMIFLRDADFDKPIILVTHQVNITALTDIYPASGEILFLELKDDELEVLQRIETE